jgi:hypothetical protein
MAISTSFFSGTVSAIVFDSLKKIKKEDQYKKRWGEVFF